MNSFRRCDGPIQSTEVWSPQNSTGSGTFDLYTGTQQSVNTFFAQLEQRTGLCEPVKLAREMGVTVPEDQVYPPFTLGIVNTDPLTMAEAYATFAGRGLHCDTAAGDRDPQQQGQAAQGVPQGLPAGAARRRSRTLSTTCCAASRSRAASGTTPASR